MSMPAPEVPKSSQLSLFPTRPALVGTERGTGTLQEAFEQFHAANPWVYDALVRIADTYRGMGHKRVGIGHLFEVLRWEYARSTTGHDLFKLNNNLRSRYVRFIQQQNPEIGDMFETRTLKAA